MFKKQELLKRLSHKWEAQAKFREEEKDDFNSSPPSEPQGSREDVPQAKVKREKVSHPYCYDMTYKCIKADTSVLHLSDLLRSIRVKICYHYFYGQVNLIVEPIMR